MDVGVVLETARAVLHVGLIVQTVDGELGGVRVARLLLDTVLRVEVGWVELLDRWVCLRWC